MARYKRVVRYSKHAREKGHPGGVEKFAWYLSQSIDVESVTPQHTPVFDDPEVLYDVDNHTRFVANSLQTRLLCGRYCGCNSDVMRLAVDESKCWPPK